MRTDFTKISTATPPTNSHDDFLRRQWLTELQNFQSDVSVCQEAIFGIPGLISASSYSSEMEQLNLATSLAQCHAQLEAAFTMIPPDVSLNIP